jgi:hypothetical protein
MLARDKHSLHEHIYYSSETKTEAGAVQAPASAINALMGKLGLAREVDRPETGETKLARDLTDPAWAVRVEAAQQLGKIGKQAPLELLLVTLRDEQSGVRAAAARALGHNPRQAAIPALVATLDDPEWLVRVEVVMALGSLPESAPLEPLLTAAHDGDAAVRAAAIWALGEVGTEQAVEQLQSALQDDDWSVREAATLALGQRAARAALPPLLSTRLDGSSSTIAPIRQPSPEMLPPLPPETAFTPRLHADGYLPLPKNVQTSAMSIGNSASLQTAETPAEYILSSKNRHQNILPETFKWPRKIEPQLIAVLGTIILVGVLVSWLVIIAWPRSTQAGVQSALALTIYHGHNSSVEKLAWSPDGVTIASADSRGMVRVWQANTGHTVTTYAQSGEVLALTWANPNTVLAAYAKVNKTLQVEELTIESGYTVQQRIFQRTNLPGIPAVADWAPDGETLAFDTGNGSIEIWNPITRMYVATIQSEQSQFQQLIWSPDGEQLASLSTNGIQIWDPSTDLNLQTLANSEQAAAVLWTPANVPGEDALVFVSNTGEITRWSELNSFQIFAPLIPQQTYNLENSRDFSITAITLSPDGEQLALATSDGIVQTRDATTLNLIDIYTGHSAQVNAIAWAPDGRSIATASTDTTVQIWQEL